MSETKTKTKTKKVAEAAEPKVAQAIRVTIPPPKTGIATFKIENDPTSPYVQLRFTQKAINMMKEKMMAGSTAKKGKTREPRDFDDDFRQSMYRTEDGRYGIPADAFRCAMISACRLVNYKMTLAKLSLFVLADGVDAQTGRPLVYLEADDPEHYEAMVRNQTGVADIRVRSMWRKWRATLRVRYDADQFTLSDVANLLHRVGLQVGIGEGRPDSKDSAGMGFGMFNVLEGGALVQSNG